MNVLHFSTADNEGGSARSAYRIHTGLKKLGIISKMLVGKKVTRDSDIDTVYGGSFGRAANLFAEYWNRFTGRQYLWVPSSKRVLVHPWVKQAQIFQLFNIHGGYFSPATLPQLSKIAPIVWRLSDEWPMTAHSAYTYGCECWKIGPEVCRCKNSSYPPIYRNATKLLWEIKEKIYAQCRITIVAPSSWIEKRAKESLLLGRFPVHRIPNGIDTKIFYPRDKTSSRQKLNIDPSAKVILFTAHGLDNNPRKGGKFLIEALQRLGVMKNTLLVLVGKGGESWRDQVPLPVKLFGFIRDPNELAEVYSCADVIAVPSEVENLPNNLLEAMACGVPAVAFDAGGIYDAVIHQETGYLVKFGDSQDLAEGIRLLLNDETLCAQMSKNGLALIQKQFTQEREAQSFAKLYRTC